jgi:hypothetical protein
VLDELASERRWDQLFQASPDLLEKLAMEARAEYRAGRSKKLDPAKL